MKSLSHISRRKFLLASGAAAIGTIAINGCTNDSDFSGQPRSLANFTGAETPVAILGFVPTIDCAPLAIAKEKNFFAKYGMTDVQLLKQASWWEIQDKVELGSKNGGIDGGHFQSPAPQLLNEGIIARLSRKTPMYVLARLNTHGVGISLRQQYRALNVRSNSSPMLPGIEKLKQKGELLKCAVTYPGCNQSLWLRYWLAAGGIDPDLDVDIVAVPDIQMAANVKSGKIDVLCAADPWNLHLANAKLGFTAITTGEIWENHPEKVFAMRSDWVDRHSRATLAILRGLMEAQIWCDRAENQDEMCRILSANSYLKLNVKDIAPRVKGNFKYGSDRTIAAPSLAVKFWTNDGVSVSYPYKSHDLWFLIENIRWGMISPNLEVNEIVDAVNREDLWREAAQSLGIPSRGIPSNTSRGVETFFDGIRFDPANPNAYLKSLNIKRI